MIIDNLRSDSRYDFFIDIALSFLLTSIFLARVLGSRISKLFIAIFILTLGVIILIKYLKTITLFEYLLMPSIVLLSIAGMLNGGVFFLKNFYLYLSLFGLIIGIVITNKKTPSWVFLLPFIFILLVVFYSIIKTGGLLKGPYFYDLNRNSLPVFAISYGILFTTNQYLKKEKVSIFVSILSLFISFYSQSRTGLLIAVLFVIVIVVYRLHCLYIKRANKEIRPKIDLRIIIVLAFILTTTTIYILFKNSRYSEVGFSSSGRIEIYTTFFKELSWKNFVLGFYPTPLKQYSSLHDSYLQIIADVGVFSLLIFYVSLISLFYLCKTNKLLALFLLILFAYGIPEAIIYLRLADMALLPLLIIAFKRSKIFSKTFEFKLKGDKSDSLS